MSNLGNNPEERIINCYKNHCNWIDKAILAEESNALESAIKNYITGLEYANICLNETVTGTSLEQVKAKEIQNKLLFSHQLFFERLESLLSQKPNHEKHNRKLIKFTSLESDKAGFNRSTEKLKRRSTKKMTTSTDKSTAQTIVTKPITNIMRSPTQEGSPVLGLEKKLPESETSFDKESIMKKLKNVDRDAVETILNEVLDSKVIKFEDIAGNESAKQCLLETVIYPKLRPELFTGLRSPAKGILLFGPPGNGKTLLAKAVANESKCTFFNISAASLMSKWVGETEKLVRALFAVANHVSPSVIFLDEVDSLLAARNSDDKNVSRRMLTQFLQEIDGAATDGNCKVLVMAATNRPFELDVAALRRFQKKIYIKMPDSTSRKFLLKKLLSLQTSNFNESEIDYLVELTKNYSSSDLTNLAKTAAMEPIRELSFKQICTVRINSMRPIRYNDFVSALKQIKPSVSQESMIKYDKWNSQFGDSS